MPRIPQGEFDTNPSTRVGAPEVRLPPDPKNNLGNAVAGLTGAMAQLQDQTERTEAYQKANDIKTQYLQKKTVYETALQTVNGKGVVDYYDPSDSNPDISKRRRIQRPVGELYKDMVDSYEESKKELNGLARADIASDLARQYVGDDLIQTQLKTNKLINRQREKETINSVTENIHLNLAGLVEKATAGDASDESIQLSLAQMNNKMARDLGYAGNILGAEQVADIQKLKDRAYGTAAQQIISAGVTKQTVKTADELVARIKDPAMKSLTMTRLENVKRTTSEVKSISVINSAQGLSQKIDAASHLDDEDYVKAVNTAKQTLSIYTDPKYNSVVNDELKEKHAGNLLSTALASRQSLELMDVDMSFLVNPASDVDESKGEATGWGARQEGAQGSRGLASMDGPRMRALKEQLGAEFEASGLGKVVGGNEKLKAAVIEQTVQKMRSRRLSMKDNLADMVAAKYPNASPSEKLERIKQVANTQALGEVSLVGKKEQMQFKQNFESLMAKSPESALNFYAQTLNGAGEALEGEASNKRAMAIDLAGKDSSLAFLIPMADADGPTQYQMIRDAATFKQVTTETDANASHFSENFDNIKDRIPALQPLFRNNPSVYSGVRQLVMNRAAAKLAAKQGGTKADVPKLMKEAMEEVGSMYTSVASSDGRSSILAVNRSKNYGAIPADTLTTGMQVATTLPAFSKADKIDIINRYQKQIGAKLEVNEHTPDDHLNFILGRQVRIEPDGRYPNVHTYKIGEFPLSKKDGTRLTVDLDSIVQWGQDERAKAKKKYGAN